MAEEIKRISVRNRDGKYLLQTGGDGAGTVVRIVWARPLSGHAQEIAFLDEKKKCVSMINSLNDLDSESRAVVEEALQMRYLMARIVRVNKAKTHFGTRFLDVETDRGIRAFALRDPNRNILHFDEDRICIRDTIGNIYEIESLGGLDRKSQAEIEKIL